MKYNKIKFLLFSFFLLTIHPLFLYFYKLNLNGGDEWLTADWLISYDYGFIRRGLFGSFLNFFELLGVQKLVGLSFILSFLYIIIFYLIIKIFFERKQNFISYILLFSPIFLFFPILDIRGSYRKELLGFLFILYLVNFTNEKYEKKVKIVSILLFTISIFSSEVNLLFLPFIVWYFKIKKIDSKEIFPYIFVSVVYVVLYFIFVDTFEIKIIKICNSLLEQRFDSKICGGSLSAMSLGINETYKIFGMENIISEKSKAYFSILIISLLPLFFTNWFYKNINNALFALFIFFPIFVISADWGRWIHIYISSIIILYFSADKKESTIKIPKIIQLIIVSANTLSWNVNHYTETIGSILNNILENNYHNYLYLINLVY